MWQSKDFIINSEGDIKTAMLYKSLEKFSSRSSFHCWKPLCQVKLWREKPATWENQASFLNQKLKIRVQSNEQSEQREESDQCHRAKKLKTKYVKATGCLRGSKHDPDIWENQLVHSTWWKGPLENEFGIICWQALNACKSLTLSCSKVEVWDHFLKENDLSRSLI